jgi:hypothetical protein
MEETGYFREDNLYAFLHNTKTRWAVVMWWNKWESTFVEYRNAPVTNCGAGKCRSAVCHTHCGRSTFAFIISLLLCTTGSSLNTDTNVVPLKPLLHEPKGISIRLARRPPSALASLYPSKARSSSKWHLNIQSVPRRKHRTSPLQRSTG